MKIIITTLFIVLLSACATPHIQNNNNILEITMNDKSLIKEKGHLLYKNRVNLGDINVEQKVYLMKNATVLTYEDASVSSGYVYNYGMNRTIGILFPDYNYNLVDTKGNIHFFILSDKETKIYMILENMNKKRIKMIYGLSQKVFEELFDTLVSEKEVDIDSNFSHTTYQITINEDKSKYIKSRWNSKNIILDAIITKMGGRVKVGR